MAYSIDPDEVAHNDHLIWIHSVCICLNFGHLGWRDKRSPINVSVRQMKIDYYSFLSAFSLIGISARSLATYMFICDC